jgi:lambda family phage minor tail protein L
MNTLFKLNNYIILDLFELELEPNEGYLRIHGCKNFDSNLIFQENEYIFMPCEFSNFESTSDGRQSRPSLKISNINNYISKVLKDRGDLIGKNFFRKRIFAKDLDIINFKDGINPFGVSAFNTYISNDKFIINLKKSENKNTVELELVTKIDLENLSLPSRKVTNDTCSWGYRCSGCNYGNKPNYAGPLISCKISNSQTVSALQASSFYFKKTEWGGNSSSPDPGLPIADENNKTFLSNYKPALKNNSYGLDRLNYKGDWSPNTKYMKGDFVYVNPFSSVSSVEYEYQINFDNKPKTFFVCIEDNVSNKFPEKNSNLWKQDKCSKTLTGCLLRFQDYITQNSLTIDKALPFGAFPATFPYENNK